MQGRGRGNVAAERLCGVLFVGLTPLKGYFYINLGGTLSWRNCCRFQLKRRLKTDEFPWESTI